MKNHSNRLSTERHEPTLGQRADGKWTMHFRYSDQSYVVVINHHYASNEVEYTVEMWHEGECYKFETKEQRKTRHQITEEHGDQPSDEGYLTHWNEESITSRVDECLRRWDAIKMLVCPQVS